MMKWIFSWSKRNNTLVRYRLINREGYRRDYLFNDGRVISVYLCTNPQIYSTTGCYVSTDAFNDYAHPLLRKAFDRPSRAALAAHKAGGCSYRLPEGLQ